MIIAPSLVFTAPAMARATKYPQHQKIASQNIISKVQETTSRMKLTLNFKESLAVQGKLHMRGKWNGPRLVLGYSVGNWEYQNRNKGSGWRDVAIWTQKGLSRPLGQSQEVFSLSPMASVNGSGAAGEHLAQSGPRSIFCLFYISTCFVFYSFLFSHLSCCQTVQNSHCKEKSQPSNRHADMLEAGDLLEKTSSGPEALSRVSKYVSAFPFLQMHVKKWYRYWKQNPFFEGLELVDDVIQYFICIECCDL